MNAEAALAYCDPTKEVTLQVDALSTGLGAALLQDKKPIAFARITLTDTESCYDNFKQELLVVVNGCENPKPTYCRIFIAESDHNPLEAIQLKRLISAPPKAAKNPPTLTAIWRHSQVSTRQTSAGNRWSLTALT